MKFFNMLFRTKCLLSNKILSFSTFWAVLILAFFSDLANFQNGLETKLLDLEGWNFFWHIREHISVDATSFCLWPLWWKSGHLTVHISSFFSNSLKMGPKHEILNFLNNWNSLWSKDFVSFYFNHFSEQILKYPAILKIFRCAPRFKLRPHI